MKPFVWKDLYSFRRFLRLYIQRKFISVRLYQPCVARISAHACVWSAIMIFISSLWIALPLSGQLEIDRTEIIRWNWSSSTPSGPKENQSTVEKNEFYEWGIWRTIMKTMSGNSSICIKINSWSQIGPRQHPSLPSAHTGQSFQQLAPPDLIRSNGGPASTPPYHRSHTDQHFNSWPPRDQTRTSPAPIPTIGSYRPNLDFFQLEWPPEDNVIWRFFDGFHIEKYFHLFFFMNWILILFNSFYRWDE